MCVRFVAASHFTVIRFVAGVDVGMFLSVAAIGKASVAAFKLALKGFFP